jgi:hypothetical protein
MVWACGNNVKRKNCEKSCLRIPLKEKRILEIQERELDDV